MASTGAQTVAGSGALAKPGDVLGYRSLMSEDRYHASAAALED